MYVYTYTHTYTHKPTRATPATPSSHQLTYTHTHIHTYTHTHIHKPTRATPATPSSQQLTPKRRSRARSRSKRDPFSTRKSQGDGSYGNELTFDHDTSSIATEDVSLCLSADTSTSTSMLSAYTRRERARLGQASSRYSVDGTLRGRYSGDATPSRYSSNATTPRRDGAQNAQFDQNRTVTDRQRGSRGSYTEADGVDPSLTALTGELAGVLERGCFFVFLCVFDFFFPVLCVVGRHAYRQVVMGIYMSGVVHARR